MKGYTRKELRHAAATLRRARKLVKNPSNWGKDSFKQHGRNAKGQPVMQYCIIGAMKEADGPGEFVGTEILRRAIARTFRKNRKNMRLDEVYNFNDSKKREHADILRAFDAALELAQQEAEEANA